MQENRAFGKTSTQDEAWFISRFVQKMKGHAVRARVAELNEIVNAYLLNDHFVVNFR
jgi:hypothetical protein